MVFTWNNERAVQQPLTLTARLADGGKVLDDVLNPNCGGGRCSATLVGLARGTRYAEYELSEPGHRPAAITSPPGGLTAASNIRYPFGPAVRALELLAGDPPMAFAGDFDGDHVLDLAAWTPRSTGLVVFRGVDDGGLHYEASEFAHPGQYKSLHTSGFFGDVLGQGGSSWVAAPVGLYGDGGPLHPLVVSEGLFPVEPDGTFGAPAFEPLEFQTTSTDGGWVGLSAVAPFSSAIGDPLQVLMAIGPDEQAGRSAEIQLLRLGPSGGHVLNPVSYATPNHGLLRMVAVAVSESSATFDLYGITGSAPGGNPSSLLRWRMDQTNQIPTVVQPTVVPASAASYGPGDLIAFHDDSDSTVPGGVVVFPSSGVPRVLRHLANGAVGDFVDFSQVPGSSIWQPGRAVSGDLDMDGFDELVMEVGDSTYGELVLVQGTELARSSGLIQVTPLIANDVRGALVLDDFDGDSALDLMSITSLPDGGAHGLDFIPGTR